jgi:Uma2 family endonuclease
MGTPTTDDSLGRHSPADEQRSLDHLITDDGAPADSFFVEKQRRLLTSPLTNYWPGPGEGRPFIVASDVGLFFEPTNPALSPDVMLAIDVRLGENLQIQRNRSYFVWLLGKVPDVVIEIVSDCDGGEETYKLETYCYHGVPYYVIFDPGEHLEHGALRVFARRGDKYELADAWFPEVGLGILLWHGEFEGCTEDWLRWCYRDGQVVPVGKERERQQQQELDEIRQRAEQHCRHAGD